MWAPATWLYKFFFIYIVHDRHHVSYGDGESRAPPTTIGPSLSNPSRGGVDDWFIYTHLRGQRKPNGKLV